MIIDVLKNRYSLPLLLQKLQLSKSSYYYQEQSLQKEDKYTLLRVKSLNYLQRIKVDMVTDEFTPYLSVKI